MGCAGDGGIQSRSFKGMTTGIHKPLHATCPQNRGWGADRALSWEPGFKGGPEVTSQNIGLTFFTQ